MKIGRNDDCPCGSGKKYKRCCLTRDQAHGTERRSLDGDARSNLGETAVYKHLAVLLDLASKGGPLDHLRFNLHEFAFAFDAHIDAVSSDPDGYAWEAMLSASARELVDDEWLEHARDAARRVLRAGSCNRAERDALKFALAIPDRLDREPADAGPLLMSAYRAQWMEYLDVLRRRSAAVDELRERGVDASGDAFHLLVQPAVERVFAWFESFDPPPVLTADQLWYAAGEHRRLLEAGSDDEALTALFADLAGEIDQAQLAVALRTVWPDRKAAVENLLRDLGIALEAAPDDIFVAAADSGVCRTRNEEEREALAGAIGQPNGVRAELHATWLREHGYTDAAERLASVMNWL